MVKQNYYFSIFSLACISLLLIGCSSNQSKKQSNSINQENVPIEISVRLPIPVIDGAFAPFYIAQDHGFFIKNGLKVTLEPGSSELNPVKMVDAGVDEIGILGGPELAMTGKDKGAKIKAFALLHKNSNFACVITKKESELLTLNDLAGKDVGFFYGHISTDVLHSLLKKENVSINEVDVGFNYNQFISGQLPAQWAFTTTAGVNLPIKGIDINIISPADYGIITHGYTFITSEKIISESPILVERFLSAMIEATEYSLKNRSESVKSVLTRDGTLTEEIVTKQLDLYEEAIKNNDKIGWFTKETFTMTRDRIVDLELVSKNYNLEETFIDKFIVEYYNNKN